MPTPHAPPGPSAVHPVSIPASTAEKHAALLRHRAGSLPHPPARGARGRRGRRAAAELRAEHGVGRVLVPCGRMLGQPQVRRRCRRARRSCAAQLCMRPHYILAGLGPPLECVVECGLGSRMAVARLSYGVRAVNVGMCSSGPCCRACSVGTDDAELHVSWYGCYLTRQGGRSTRLPFKRVSRGLGVRPTIVGLVLSDLTGYP